MIQAKAVLSRPAGNASALGARGQTSLNPVTLAGVLAIGEAELLTSSDGASQFEEQRLTFGDLLKVRLRGVVRHRRDTARDQQVVADTELVFVGEGRVSVGR